MNYHPPYRPPQLRGQRQDSWQNWSKEERTNLNKLLNRFGKNDRAQHWKILDICPRNHNFQPTKGRPWLIPVKALKIGREPDADEPPEFQRLRDMDRVLTEEMIYAGWCPSTIQLLRGAFHIPGLHLARLQGLPRASRRLHTDCTVTQCKALQIQEDRKASHTEGCARNCASVVVDDAEVARIVMKGGIPLVVVPPLDLFSDGRSHINLEIVEYTGSSTSFVAISHVYAHGFGNGNNTMSLCQLNRLRRVLAECDRRRTPLIWIDVFSVPSTKLYSGLRGTAVSQITRNFRAAERVFVLDTALLQTPRERNSVELSMRILASDWMRRVWTLEEAMLACIDGEKDTVGDNSDGRPERDPIDRMDKLIFRFANGQVSLGQLLRDLQKRKCPYARSAILALQEHLTLPNLEGNFYPSIHSDAARFARLAKALEYRNTSRPGDDIFCIASILTLEDTGPILKAKGALGKAKEFYRAIKFLPLSILYCNGLRVPEAPFRWAIRSFLTSDVYDNPNKMNPLEKDVPNICHPKEDGLHVQTQGIFFKLRNHQTSNFNRVWIDDKSDPMCLILEPTSWEKGVMPPLITGWSKLQEVSYTDELVLLINPGSRYEGVVLRNLGLRLRSSTYLTEFLCQVHIGRIRAKRFVDVGLIRKQESTGWYRLNDPDAQDSRKGATKIDGTRPGRKKKPRVNEGVYPEDRVRAWADRKGHTTGSQHWVIT